MNARIAELEAERVEHRKKIERLRAAELAAPHKRRIYFRLARLIINGLCPEIVMPWLRTPEVLLELQDCQRAVKADEAAKLSLAEQRAREQMKFQERALEASKRAIERGLQILNEPAKGSKPSDAARLLAVGDAIGRAALGLGGVTGHFGLHPTAPANIKVVVHEDETSRRAKRLEDEFFEQHPEEKRGPDFLKVVDATIIDENGVARRARDDP